MEPIEKELLVQDIGFKRGINNGQKKYVTGTGTAVTKKIFYMMFMICNSILVRLDLLHIRS